MKFASVLKSFQTWVSFKVVFSTRFCSLLQLTSCYATIGGIHLSACRVSLSLLKGIEYAYMKGVFDAAAIAVFSTRTVHEIFIHSLPLRVGYSFQGTLFSIFNLLCLVFVSYYLSTRTALENCVLSVMALRCSWENFFADTRFVLLTQAITQLVFSVDCTGELIIRFRKHSPSSPKRVSVIELT